MTANRPGHHPGPELLMDYASGALPEPLALLVATHASLCLSCQGEIGRLEALGGALIESLDGELLDRGALDRTLACLDLPDGLQASAACRASEVAGDPRLPTPLRGYVPDGLDHVPWKHRGSVEEHSLLRGCPGIKTRLLRVKAGAAVPQHSHTGNEYTLLLAGGFSDATGHYLRGDVAIADHSVDHRPVADPGEDCLCLLVTDAPLRLTGRFGRYLNFIVRL